MSDIANYTLIDHKGLLPDANIAIASAVILSGIAVSCMVCFTWHQPTDYPSRAHTALRYVIGATGAISSVLGIIYVARNS